MPERPRLAKPVSNPVLRRDRNTRRYGSGTGGGGAGSGGGGGVNWGGDIGVYGVGLYSRCFYGLRWGVYGADKYGQTAYGMSRPFPDVPTYRLVAIATPDGYFDYEDNLAAAYEVVFVDTDADGVVYVLPTGVEGLHHKVINCGTSGNPVQVFPQGDGANAVMGEEYSELSDGEVLDLHYNSVEGWW